MSSIERVYAHVDQLHPGIRDLMHQSQRNGLQWQIHKIGVALEAYSTTTLLPFYKDTKTLSLLMAIKRDVEELHRIQSPAFRWNETWDYCFQKTLDKIQKCLGAIREVRKEYGDWLCSAEANKSDHVRYVVENLKQYPKKLLTFFETAVTFRFWSLENEQILVECYEQLARFAAAHRFTKKEAHRIAEMARLSDIPHLAGLECKLGREIFYIDKVLFALQCPNFERFFKQSLIPMPAELSREGLLSWITYLETGQMPQSEEGKVQMLPAFDFFGLHLAEIIPSLLEPYSACLTLTRQANESFKLTLKDPVDLKALQLLQMPLISCHLFEVDLSACTVTDDLLEALTECAPQMRTITIPSPNQVTQVGWEKLSQVSSLKRVEMLIKADCWRALQNMTMATESNHFQLVLNVAYPPANPDVWTILETHPIARHALLALDARKLKSNDQTDFLVDLATRLPTVCSRLIRINLSGTLFTETSFQSFVSRSPRLEELDVSGTFITQGSIAFLAEKCKQLRALSMGSLNSDHNKDLDVLRECKALKILNIKTLNMDVTGRQMERCSYSLEELHLPMKVSQSSLLRKLADRHNLVKLSVFAQVDKNDLFYLADKGTLVELNVPYTPLSKGDIARIKAGSPWVTVKSPAHLELDL